jgi:hypothetical protein
VDEGRLSANSRLGVVIAVAVALGVVAYFAFTGGDDDKPAAPGAPNPPAPVSETDLSGLSKSLGQPVYWAGGKKDTQFQLTRQKDQIRVAYPAAAGANAAQGLLTIGTYRLPDALAAVLRAGKTPTAKVYELERGGRAVSDSNRPTNVYFAYPKQDFQVEVYDPKPGRALKLVLRGKVRPVP